MSKYNIDQLQSRDLDLYHDICQSNSIIPRLTHITQRQIELLISMRDIVAPYTPYIPHTKIRTENRLWKVL
jgi:hypothetical protein